MNLDVKLSQARDIVQQAQREHKPRKTFVLFSGGNDSTILLHWAWHAGLIDAAAHINTGIGVEETRDFVRQFCADLQIPLIEKFAPPNRYRELVLKYGFPGPSAHRYMYIYLKELQVRALVRENKVERHDRIMLLTGVRKSESRRRMGTVTAVKREGARVWVAPFVDFTIDELRDYRERFAVPENPVAALLHMSGECLCGAYARPGELQDLETFYPKTAAHIRALMEEVAATDVKHKVWGAGGRSKRAGKLGPLCHACEQATEEEDEG